ncbi:MAG: right-handed parallel beta-helix repeat-containing protein [Spirochaetaceae bacterium]|nr:right-handed parallel beta-helix repeat-containing protein [Spirochaetaceae bacterium]
MKTLYKCLLLAGLLAIYCSSCEMAVTEEVYIIDNAAFGISSDRTNARATNAGINTAIAKAKKDGYNVVKLTKGEYLLSAGRDGLGYANQSGIYVPSFITLDLTDASIYMEPNHYTGYTLIRLNMVEDVTIIGGHLIGDRKEHDYTTIEHTHEFGYGIAILGSKNVTIRDMNIEQMTGDAIVIGGYAYINDRHRSRDVQILNCDLGHCRRQGISMGHAQNVEIAYNKIHHIGLLEDGIDGTAPGMGIDIEPAGGEGWNERVDRVNIHHNEFGYTAVYGVCIVHRTSTDIEVADNIFQGVNNVMPGGILVDWGAERIRVVRNTLRDCTMRARIAVDVYMPVEGPNKNILEPGPDWPWYRWWAANDSEQTGYVTETDNLSGMI